MKRFFDNVKITGFIPRNSFEPFLDEFKIPFMFAPKNSKEFIDLINNNTRFDFIKVLEEDITKEYMCINSMTLFAFYETKNDLTVIFIDNKNFCHSKQENKYVKRYEYQKLFGIS